MSVCHQQISGTTKPILPYCKVYKVIEIGYTVKKLK